MEIVKSLGGGVAGACALTLLHETMRRVTPEAPRMDILGMRAIAYSMRASDMYPPSEKKLFSMAMAGDMVTNSLYYSLAGTNKSRWIRGGLLGLAAGVGAVLLPGPLGLGEEPSARSLTTKALTVALYLSGGLVAAAAAGLMSKDKEHIDK